MIRVIVVALLAANLLLLGLRVAQPEAPRVDPQAPQRSMDQRTGGIELPELHLLGEALEQSEGPGRLARCFSLGPFTERADLGAAFRRMNRGRAWNEIRETRALVERGWWVYLPRFANRAEAEAAALALRDAGVNDIAVMLSGDQANTVSLGLYDRRETASARVEAVRALGFDAQMRVRREPEPRFWLDYDPRALAVNGDELAAELSVYNRPMPCPRSPLPADAATSPLASGP